MSFRQTWEGSDRKSVISALDGRTKLSFLLLYAFMMIIVDNGRTLFILFTLTLLFHFLGKTPVYKWKVLAIFLLLGLITVGCVLLITVYLIISGIPAIKEIGLVKFLFGKEWASTAAEPKFGILPFILTSVYGTAGAILIGVPVGFVNVVESKELLLTLDVPYIVARGRKGGSNVAAAICNAMLYQASNNARE